MFIPYLGPILTKKCEKFNWVFFQIMQQMQWNPQLAATMNSWHNSQQPQSAQQQKPPTASSGGQTQVHQKTQPFQPPTGTSSTSLSREPDLNKAVQNSAAMAAAAAAAQAAASAASSSMTSTTSSSLTTSSSTTSAALRRPPVPNRDSPLRPSQSPRGIFISLFLELSPLHFFS